jgi:anti-sigma factor RsiW
MTDQNHDRALELIMRRGTEDIASRDADWLNAHLESCVACAAYAEDFEQTGHLLRSVAVTATPALVARTQQRVQARALYLQEQQSRMVLIAISFCLGVLSSVTSAYLWWKFGGWVAERVGLPQFIVQPGILLFLLLPAVVIAALMLAFPAPVLEERFMAALARGRDGGDQ